jgi:hypothetical protein
MGSHLSNRIAEIAAMSANISCKFHRHPDRRDAKWATTEDRIANGQLMTGERSSLGPYWH